MNYWLLGYAWGVVVYAPFSYLMMRRADVAEAEDGFWFAVGAGIFWPIIAPLNLSYLGWKWALS